MDRQAHFSNSKGCCFPNAVNFADSVADQVHMKRQPVRHNATLLEYSLAIVNWFHFLWERTHHHIPRDTREYLKWQSNTNTSVSLHCTWITASGFLFAHSTTCWIIIISDSVLQFRGVAYFSCSKSTVFILSGLSSKPRLWCILLQIRVVLLVPSGGQLWDWWAALCSELPSVILTVEGEENLERAHNQQHSSCLVA